MHLLELPRTWGKGKRPIKTLDDAKGSFWEKVVIPENGDDCWGWLAEKDQWGYGRLWLGAHNRPRRILAHRFSYLIHKGEITDGLEVLHSCHNPECSNPSHLRLGTQKDNMQDRLKMGRYRLGENNHRASLTDEKVRALRWAASITSLNQTQLCRHFGMRQNQVSRVLRRETWKHVEDLGEF